MKILHLIDSGGLYGAEKMLIALCLEQIKAGMDVVVLSCGEQDEPEKPLEIALKENNIEVMGWRMAAGFNIKGMRDILLWAKEQNFSLLHSHGYKFNVLLALTKNRYLKIPIVSTVHGYVNAKFPHKSWLYESLDKIMLGRLNAVVRVNSSVQIPLLLKALYGKRLFFIENGIQDNELSITRTKSTLKKLLIVGRLSPEKGHVDLINAMPQLIANDPDITLSIAGDGPLKSELIHQVEALNIGGHISFLGFVDDMSALYQDHDALIMPSYTEGLPITLLESIACGLPVFATAVGGIPEIIRDGACIINVADSHSIVEKIRGWNALPEKHRNRIIADHRTAFETRYTAQRMCETYHAVYSSIYRQ